MLQTRPRPIYNAVAPAVTQADFVPLAIEFPANYLTVAARLPAYGIVAGTSLHAHLTVPPLLLASPP